MHEISVREAYIDGALRDASDRLRRVTGVGCALSTSKATVLTDERRNFGPLLGKNIRAAMARGPVEEPPTASKATDTPVRGWVEK
jgi:hypothetical protein